MQSGRQTDVAFSASRHDSYFGEDGKSALALPAGNDKRAEFRFKNKTLWAGHKAGTTIHTHHTQTEEAKPHMDDNDDERLVACWLAIKKTLSAHVL